ncbi:MAG: response regulator [Thermoplasmatota archaeon]
MDGERFLIIDDDVMAQRLFAAYVMDAPSSHAVPECVSNLAEGLERLRQGAFSAILTDLTLPDAQGVTVVEKLRAAAPNLTLVVLSGHDDERLRASCIRAGADAYLVKGTILEKELRTEITSARQRRLP